ncbi:uncharacterized protein [Venturia canescens]|uniref:uncharacterized protein n=1 Tax=Venturia canescens TaxID=32260 RepID=UPI001C9D6305|nr:uncharacterized protein LOC122409676 [Venturia canescens]
MNSARNEYYETNLFLMALCGVSPYQKKNSRFLAYLVCCSIAGTQICTKVAFVARAWPDLNIVIQNLSIILIDIISIVKITNCAFKIHKIKNLFDRILFSSDPLLSSEELDIIERHDERCRKFIKFWFAYLVSTLSIFNIMPLVKQFFDPAGKNINEVPLPVHYGYIDVQQYFGLVWVHGYITGLILMTFLAVTDSIYVVFVENACAMFSIVSYRLKNAVPSDEQYTDANVTKYNDVGYKNFIDCIKRHNAAIKFATEVEFFTSTSFLLTVGINMIIVSFTGTQIVESVDELETLVRHVSLITAQIIHLYLDNYYAQKLYNSSSDVYMNITQSNWENASLRTKKLLCMMTMQSLAPSVITIGGFQTMSLDTFNWLLRTSASCTLNPIRFPIFKEYLEQMLFLPLAPVCLIIEPHSMQLFRIRMTEKRRIPRSNEHKVKLPGNPFGKLGKTVSFDVDAYNSNLNVNEEFKWFYFTSEFMMRKVTLSIGMDIKLERYYKINKILMSSIGQWPYQSTFTKWCFLTLSIFLCACQMAPQICAAFIYRRDPEIFIECVTPFLFDIVCLAKLANFMYNSNKLLTLMNRMEENWKTWECDEENVIIHEYTELGRKFSTVYAVMIWLTAILYMSQPIIPKYIDALLYNNSQPGVFPVPVYYFQLDDQKYFFYIIAFTYVCTSALIIINVAGDTMFFAHVQHCCAIFAALGRKLERIGERNRISKDMISDFQYLGMCINRHNDAIEFADLMESTYSACFLFVIGNNMLMLSITAFQITTKANEPQDTIRYVAFVVAQLFHLFMETHMSQMLMDHSAAIRNSLQNAKWYQTSVKSQKIMNLMLMRSSKPCKLTAGKICVMSVETFGVVVKTSVSYFTLLQSMQ